MDRAASGVQGRQDVLTDRTGADGVEQYLDLDACARLGSQGLRELTSRVAFPIDVRLNGDGRLGPGDRLEHRWVKLVAVVQDREVVALCKRNAGRARDRTQEFGRVDGEFVSQSVPRR